MGAVASRLSDVVIVTSDNPAPSPGGYSRRDTEGMNGGRKAERHAIVDRREAIERALEMARPGDAS